MISTHLNLILDPSGGGTSATSIFLEELWWKKNLYNRSNKDNNNNFDSYDNHNEN